MESDQHGHHRKKDPQEEEEITPECLQLAVLAYLPVLCLVAVINHRRERFVNFHLRQGMCLFALELFTSAIYFLPVIGPFVAVVLAAGCAGLTAMCIRMARQKICWEAPVLAWMSGRFGL